MIPGLTASYKSETPMGIHGENDRYMLALYTDGSALTEFTTVYTTKGEARGPGYAAGGIALQGFRVELDGACACWAWDDATWPNVTLSAVVGGLVYNASKGNRSVGVIGLAEKSSSTNGPFTVFFPEPTADTAVFCQD